MNWHTQYNIQLKWFNFLHVEYNQFFRIQNNSEEFTCRTKQVCLIHNRNMKAWLVYGITWSILNRSNGDLKSHKWRISRIFSCWFCYERNFIFHYVHMNKIWNKKSNTIQKREDNIWIAPIVCAWRNNFFKSLWKRHDFHLKVKRDRMKKKE